MEKFNAIKKVELLFSLEDAICDNEELLVIRGGRDIVPLGGNINCDCHCGDSGNVNCNCHCKPTQED